MSEGYGQGRTVRRDWLIDRSTGCTRIAEGELEWVELIEDGNGGAIGEGRVQGREAIGSREQIDSCRYCGAGLVESRAKEGP